MQVSPRCLSAAAVIFAVLLHVLGLPAPQDAFKVMQEQIKQLELEKITLSQVSRILHCNAPGLLAGHQMVVGWGASVAAACQHGQEQSTFNYDSDNQAHTLPAIRSSMVKVPASVQAGAAGSTLARHCCCHTPPSHSFAASKT
jgi:hypothetical protein